MLSFFPLDVLDETWDVTELVSEGFLTYSCISELLCLNCVEIIQNLPVHSFNALIIPILRDCLPNYFLDLCFVFVACRCFIWRTKAELRARVGQPQTDSSPQVILLLAVPRRLFCFGYLVVLDVVFRYSSLFL